MNKQLFWTGIAFQGIHLGLLILFGLAFMFMSIDWSFITWKLALGVGYAIFNLASLIMIFIGALSKEK